MYAYVNGEYADADQAKISIFDRGFTFGDAVFDSTRTFQGRVFKIEQHLDRLRKSLNYMELDGRQVVAEARKAVTGVVERSKAEIEAAGDVMLSIYGTRGGLNRSVAAELAGTQDGTVRPTVVVFLREIDHAGLARVYESGVDLGVSLQTRHYQGFIDPRVKSSNRFGAARGDLKGTRAAAAGARGMWTVIFGNDGSIAETGHANICIIEGNKLVRPPVYEALGGISLETACELALSIGLEVEERKIWIYDLINADEVFLTGSSFQILPIVTIDGVGLSSKREVYNRLLRSWFELVGTDFVQDSRDYAKRRIGTASVSAG